MSNTYRRFNVRQFSCRLLELIDEGLLDPTSVVEMCVNYMSEADVKDMMWMNEIHNLVEDAA
jgi:hypothetical protein